jgi:large subunit ribosomal protein L29
MKMKEILEKQGDQLDHELVEQQKHLFDLRSQAVTEKLEDPSQIGKTRRDIARIKTVLRQRQLEQAGQRKAQTPAEKTAAAAGEAARKEAEREANAPAFGRRQRFNAVKQKVRARRSGGGKTAARKVKARKAVFVHRRKPRAANSK